MILDFVYEPMIVEEESAADIMKGGKFNFAYYVRQRLPEQLGMGSNFIRK